jgi:uncharacterized protein YceK
MSGFRLLLPVLFATLTGCGTVHNLKAHPDEVGMICPRPAPMGGVTRSALAAAFFPPIGIVEMGKGTAQFARGDFKEGADVWNHGAKLFCFGIGAWFDTPVSLVADVVTLPLAYARMKSYPWAMKWGDQQPNYVKPDKPDSKDDPPSKSEEPNPIPASIPEIPIAPIPVPQEK